MPPAIGIAVKNYTSALITAVEQGQQWLCTLSAVCLDALGKRYVFFDQEVSTGRIKLVVVDNPTMDHKTIGLLAGVYEMERQMIRDRTQASMDRIKAEIAEKGSYTSKSGRVITKMGNPVAVEEAARKGRELQAKLADDRASDVWPMISNMLEQGHSLREIARQLNRMEVPTPSKRRNPDLSKNTEWYASSVSNYIKRMKG